MKKYALVKNNAVDRFFTFEAAPPLAENKGKFVEVNDPGAPEYNPETQVLESSGRMYYGKWLIEYTVRNKTPLELWAHPEYSKRINIPLLSILDYSALAVLLQVQNCPTVQKSDGTVDVYLNYILPEHQTLINSDENLTLTERPLE